MTTTDVVDDVESAGEVKIDRQSDDSILEEAKERWRLTEQAESPWKARCREDWEFYQGEQWDAATKSQRFAEDRPCLTVNDLPIIAAQAINGTLSNPPQIKITPVEDSDVETAEIIQGLTRQVEVASDASDAYQTAMEHLVPMGFACWRVLTEEEPDYEDGRQCIKVVPVDDPFCVWIDHASRALDHSDARYFFIRGSMSKSEANREWPKYDGESSTTAQGAGETWSEPSDMMALLEYWRVREEKYWEIAPPDGGPAIESGVEPPQQKELVLLGGSVRKRTRRIVEWFKLTESQVLERGEWAGTRLPIIRVYARRSRIGGQFDVKGIVRDAKDACRMYNYAITKQAESVALMSNAPYIAAKGQIEAYRKEWEDSNRKNYGVLMYDPMDINGSPVPAPQRNFGEPAIQGITVMVGQCDKDKKATTGYWGAALGQPGRERTGVAIRSLQNEGDQANSHWAHKLSVGVKATGKIVVELIQKLYDTKRIARILMPNGQQKTVMLMPGEPEANDPMLAKTDYSHVFDVTTGKFDISISTGPTYDNMRKEMADKTIESAKVIPMLAQAAPDLIIQSLGIPHSDEIVKRLHKSLPPNLQDAPKGQFEIPPQIQQQMAQMGQQIEIMTKIIDDQAKRIEGDAAEAEGRERVAQINSESNERIAALRAEVDLLKARLSSDSDREVQALWAEIESLKLLNKMSTPAPMNSAM